MTAIERRTSKDIRDAYQLVKDLMKPNSVRYWSELLRSAVAAWVVFLVTCLAPLWSITMWASMAASILLWYRALFMIHELTHRRRDELPGFHNAWNVLVGAPILLPSIFYEGIHSLHHKRCTYGTDRDPEYVPMAGRPWVVTAFLLASCMQPLLLAFRFFVGAPISWVWAKLRRRLFKYGSAYTIRPIFERRTTLDEEREIVKWELLILAFWTPLLAATAAGWLHWRWLVTWYAVYSGLTLVNRVRMACAHRFESDGRPLEHWTQFADSIDTPGGIWAELLAPLGSKYHALHHLFPSLPFHNAKEAYERLSAAPSANAYCESTSPNFCRSFASLVSGGRPRA